MQFPVHRSLIIVKHAVESCVLIFALITFRFAFTKPRHPHAPHGIDILAWIIFGTWLVRHAFGWASVVTLKLWLLYTYLVILMINLAAVAFVITNVSTQSIHTIIVFIVLFIEAILYIILVRKVRRKRALGVATAPPVYYSPSSPGYPV